MSTETASAQKARAKFARKAFPRENLAEFIPVDRDPVALIKAEDEGRVAELVPLRHDRMAQSEFTFFRGSAGLMAHDLAQQPQTGTQIVICGDAHVNNFGLYASPERRLVFDLNDFDESAPGPWEWDVRRLLTSAVLAAREIGATEESASKIARVGASQYRKKLAELLHLSALERHYFSIDSDDIAQKVRVTGELALQQITRKARRRDSDRTIAHLMGPDQMGFLKFNEEPPILTHITEENEADIQKMLVAYHQSTTDDINYLLTRFTLTDIAMRVVGVGSVGTRCYVVALTGPEGHGLVLQAKEARQSVVTKYSTPNITTPQTLDPTRGEGARVVTQQRILQAVSDPFLGHIAGFKRDFYVRQFRDQKGSFDTTQMNEEELATYVSLCSLMLARAHSQSPLSHWISGYIGKSEAFDDAMVQWAKSYAKQVGKDYQLFLNAIEDGRLASDSVDEVMVAQQAVAHARLPSLGEK